MQKAIIVGCSGSGKSTLSRKIHTLTGLPLYHLDNIFWRADKTRISREEFDEKLAEILHRDSWILDGDYNRTYEPRIAACDTVIFLDYAEEVCMEGITNRVGQKREDMPWVEEKVDPELVELVKEFDKKHKPKLLALLAKYPEKRVVTLHSRDEAYKWMLKEFVIGATVEGHVDRPLGTAHPDYPTMVYPINYGYVDGIMAEDDEEQDVYILGSDKPLTTYKGKIIAVYHRTNDNEDKWIVSLGDRDYADEEILEAIHFQEKYFEGELLR